MALIDLGFLWMWHEPSEKKDLNFVNWIESGFCGNLISRSGQVLWLAGRKILNAMVRFLSPVDRIH